MIKYGCCNNKEVKNLVCTQCHKLFHPGCLEKKSNYTALNGNHIWCSLKCAEAGNNEDEVINILRGEIIKLESELRDKNAFIKRLKRQSSSFVEEAEISEAQLLKEVESQKKIIRELSNKVKNLPQGTCSASVASQTECFRKIHVGVQTMLLDPNDVTTQKLKEDLMDFKKLNANMKTTTETLKSFASIGCQTFGALSCHKFVATEVEWGMVAVSAQTDEHIALICQDSPDLEKSQLRDRHGSTQTELVPKNNSECQVVAVSDNSVVECTALERDYADLLAVNHNLVTSISVLESENEAYSLEVKELKKELDSSKHPRISELAPVCRTRPTALTSRQGSTPRKVLLVAGGHGGGLVDFLNNHFGSCYRAEAILKPGSPDSELLKTAVHFSREFCKTDIVILWPSNVSSSLIDTFLQRLTHTTPLIIIGPYTHNRHTDRVIYENSLSLYKALHRRRINLAHILNISTFNILDSNKSKLLLSKAIINHIVARLGALNCSGAITSTPSTPFRSNTNDPETADVILSGDPRGTLTGTLVDSSFASAEIRKWLYVGRCAPETSAEDVVNHVSGTLGVFDVKCDIIRQDGDTISFRVGVKESQFDRLFRPTAWPSGVTVRKFFQKRNFREAKRLPDFA